jgi:hypothetical protein
MLPKLKSLVTSDLAVESLVKARKVYELYYKGIALHQHFDSLCIPRKVSKVYELCYRG